MESKQVYNAPSGRVAGSVVLALFAGGLLPLLSVLQISLLVPVVMLGGVLAVHLKARSGWLPVAVLVTAAAVCSATFMGATLALILVTASLLPSLAVMATMDRKWPFFDQLKLGVGAFGGGLVAAMLIAYGSYGGGMVTRFVDLLRTEYNRMPDAALEPLVAWMNSALPAGAALEGQAVTVDYFRAQLSGILDLMQQTYAQLLPGTLLSGALVSGVLAVLWGNWTMARRGMATNESFVGMSGWFMPGGVALGGVALWLVGLALLYGDRVNGATVYLTIAQVCGAMFSVQALAALDRRMLRAGRELGRRRLLIALAAVLALLLRGFGSALSYVGVASALFGSHGAVKLWLRERRGDSDDHSDHDDFE